MPRTLNIVNVILGGCLLSACAATWGSSYHVDSENAAGLTIRYDSFLIGIADIDKHADELCARYHKTAVPESRRDAAILPGGSVMQATYLCVAPEAAKKQAF